MSEETDHHLLSLSSEVEGGGEGCAGDAKSWRRGGGNGQHLSFCVWSWEGPLPASPSLLEPRSLCGG